MAQLLFVLVTVSFAHSGLVPAKEPISVYGQLGSDLFLPVVEACKYHGSYRFELLCGTEMIGTYHDVLLERNNYSARLMYDTANCTITLKSLSAQDGTRFNVKLFYDGDQKPNQLDIAYQVIILDPTTSGPSTSAMSHTQEDSTSRNATQVSDDGALRFISFCLSLDSVVNAALGLLLLIIQVTCPWARTPSLQLEMETDGGAGASEQRWLDRSGRTGAAGQERLDRSGRTGAAGQERLDRSGRTGAAGQERLDRSGRTGAAGQERLDRSGRTGAAGQERQDRNGSRCKLDDRRVKVASKMNYIITIVTEICSIGIMLNGFPYTWILFVIPIILFVNIGFLDCFLRHSLICFRKIFFCCSSCGDDFCSRCKLIAWYLWSAFMLLIQVLFAVFVGLLSFGDSSGIRSAWIVYLVLSLVLSMILKCAVSIIPYHCYKAKFDEVPSDDPTKTTHDPEKETSM